MANIDKLAASVVSVAAKGMKPKDIIAEVRKLHPKASKKEVVHAAFHALTQDKPLDIGTGKQLYDFALSQRTAGHEEIR